MTDLAIYNAPVPDRMRYAEALSGASLLPDSYRGKPANLLLALEYGGALGIAPMVAVQEIHIIKGKPTLSALLQAALVRRAGHTLRVTGDHLSATCSIIRGDDPDFTFETTWTIDRAKAAGLLTNDSWRKYPENMLKWRAISECVRNACADVIAGFGYTPEEMGDDTVDPYPQSAPVNGGDETPTGSVGGEAAEPAGVIEDAVVVEEYTGPLASAPTVTAGGVAGEGAPPAAHPETSGTFQAMQIKLRERFGSDRPAVLAWVSTQVGREVKSTTELDAREVGDVLAILSRRRREVAPDAS